MDIPYASARSGENARDEIRKILQHWGCNKVGFMDDFDRNELILQFEWRGQQIQFRASAQGWANAYLKENPWNTRRNVSEPEYKRKWLKQGLTAANSILRDLIKGYVTSYECGIMSLEQVFMPHMLLPNGKTILEHCKDEKLLPNLEDNNDGDS